jgi:hypothetical protein
MVQSGIDPKNNSGIQRYSHLDIPTKYQYLTGITILIHMSRFTDTILDVDNKYPCIHLYTAPTFIKTPF